MEQFLQGLLRESSFCVRWDTATNLYRYVSPRIISYVQFFIWYTGLMEFLVQRHDLPRDPVDIAFRPVGINGHLPLEQRAGRHVN